MAAERALLAQDAGPQGRSAHPVRDRPHHHALLPRRGTRAARQAAAGRRIDSPTQKEMLEAYVLSLQIPTGGFAPSSFYTQYSNPHNQFFLPHIVFTYAGMPHATQPSTSSHSPAESESSTARPASTASPSAPSPTAPTPASPTPKRQTCASCTPQWSSATRSTISPRWTGKAWPSTYTAAATSTADTDCGRSASRTQAQSTAQWRP